MNSISGVRLFTDAAAPRPATPRPAASESGPAPSRTADDVLFSPSAAPSPDEAPSTLRTSSTPQAPPAVATSTPVEVEGFLLAEVAAAPAPAFSGASRTGAVSADLPADADSHQVGEWCGEVARAALSVPERTSRITPVLAKAVAKAQSPSPAWVKANPQQVERYVQETLEHADAMHRVGLLRGQDWSQHDLEGATSKFHPEIAQFLALPGRNEAVEWAIARHNAADHHAVWSDPGSTVEDLAESASDIVNAWRMNRRVYDKPSWSWERITRFIEVSFQNNDLSAHQRDALLAAIPHQMEEESRHGLPA